MANKRRICNDTDFPGRTESHRAANGSIAPFLTTEYDPSLRRDVLLVAHVSLGGQYGSPPRLARTRAVRV